MVNNTILPATDLRFDAGPMGSFPVFPYNILKGILKPYVNFTCVWEGGMTAMKQKPKQPQIRCPYCGREAVLRSASYVHKEKALEEYLYVCSGYPQCDSYVGVHTGTKTPRGSLADRNLRRKRTQAHRCLMPSGRTASSPEKMPTAGCRIPSVSPAGRHAPASFQTTAVTA